jgi:capsular exopolysaccharide synthesis family protein
VAEAFKNLRANLFFSAPAEQQSTILVTSPSGGNGKTTVASNLAIAIALTGRRVLLIDANFRRAALPRIFSGMRTDGLSNILIGQGHLDDYVTASSVPGLDLVSAGPIPPNPAELLGSSSLRDMLLEARARYDQIILDGPPVLLVSDAIVLSGAVDGVILVCQYRATSRGALQRSQSQLNAVNANIYGAVLNRVESRAGGYFRKNYREFYQYSEPDEDAADRPKLDGASAVAAATQVPGEDSATSLGMEAGEGGVSVAQAAADSELGLGEDATAAGGSDALDQEIASLGADLESGASLSGDSELGLSPDEPGHEDKPGDEPNPAR